MTRDNAKICTLPGCGKVQWVKGHCRMHHERWLRHGDPYVVLKKGPKKGCKVRPEDAARRAQSNRRPLAQRFEGKFIPEPNSGCWLWLGALNSMGYGQLREKRKAVLATHISLELAGRPVPSGLFACHRCDNPYCVNPDHLFIGTQRDNMQDCSRKGRANLAGLALGRALRHRRPAA